MQKKEDFTDNDPDNNRNEKWYKVNNSNCSEQAESLADEAARTDLRCEQTPSALLIFMGLRIVSVKVLNRYKQ